MVITERLFRAAPDDIFNDALELNSEERSTYLARACAGDPDLHDLIEQMLVIADRNESLLEPPGESSPPNLIGNYQIVRECGRGGMGIVFEAIDTKLGRRVVLKVLPPELAMQRTRLEGFEREARLLASLNHDRIATLYSLEETAGTRFFTMEFVEARTLADVLHEKPLLLNDSLRIGLQVAEALEYAHSHRVVHRDLKPSNIMLTSEGQVKVLDFGIAKALDAETRSTTDMPEAKRKTTVLRGTPGYMSPEQLLDHPVDHRADLWAFGCVMYECLTGVPAFRSLPTGAREELAAVRAPEFKEFSRAVPPKLRSLVRQCLEVDPAKRPASSAAIARTLTTLLSRGRLLPIMILRRNLDMVPVRLAC